MTDKALTVREMSLAETMTLGETLAKSGFFTDARQAAQAVVKILAGRELGFGPIASMTGIHVIQGKIAIGANLMAASIKRDPRYDYKVVKLDDEGCALEFYANGTKAGGSTFTMQNAKETLYWNSKTSKMEPLASKFNWRSYPRNMCFARALSNGFRWYCPDAGGGATVYTPEELGATVDEEGEMLTVPSVDVTPPADIDHEADLSEAEREVADLGESTKKEPPTARRSWPPEIVQAIMDANLAKPAKHAISMLNLSRVLRTTDELEFVMTWANHYRGAREDGKEPEDAARHADAQMP